MTVRRWLFWTVLISAAAALAPAAGGYPGPLSAQTVEQNDSSAQAARRANSLPLITSRTLDFTTDEGTWIDVDLHPDGETIVFELLGDLYTLPIAGGAADGFAAGNGNTFPGLYDALGRYAFVVLSIEAS